MRVLETTIRCGVLVFDTQLESSVFSIRHVFSCEV